MGQRNAVVLADIGDGWPADRPAGMLEVAGRTLIDRQLAALAECGVRKVYIVAGRHEQCLRDRVGARATFIPNPAHATTSGLCSLRLASRQVEAGAVVLKANVLFTPLLLHRLFASEYPDALLLDSRRPLGPDAMKVKLAGSFVIDIGRDLPAECAAGQPVGLLKVGPEGGRRLVKVIARKVSDRALGGSAAGAVAELARTWPVMGIDTDGLPWTAIEGPADLEHATRVVAPAIDGLAPAQGVEVRG